MTSGLRTPAKLALRLWGVAPASRRTRPDCRGASNPRRLAIAGRHPIGQGAFRWPQGKYSWRRRPARNHGGRWSGSRCATKWLRRVYKPEDVSLALPCLRAGGDRLWAGSGDAVRQRGRARGAGGVGLQPRPMRRNRFRLLPPVPRVPARCRRRTRRRRAVRGGRSCARARCLVAPGHGPAVRRDRAVGRPAVRARHDR